MEFSEEVVRSEVEREHFESQLSNESSHQETIGSSIYNLLIKNVSKNQPLTNEEAQELKAFRSTLTTEQWQSWLQFAREEKQKMRAKRASPPKSSILSKDPEQLLRAILKTEQVTAKPLTEHIAVKDAFEGDATHHRHTSHTDVLKVHISKRLQTSLSDQSPSTQQPTGTPSAVGLSQWELHSEPFKPNGDAELVAQSQATKTASLIAPRFWDTRHQSEFDGNSQNAGIERNHAAGVSLDLGMIRRSSRGRASSAPRDRPAPSVNFATNNYPTQSTRFMGSGYYSGPVPERKQSPTHSPKLKHSRPEDFFGGRDRSTQGYGHGTSHSSTPVSGAHRSRSSNRGGPSAGPYSSRVGKQQQLNSPSLDLADAAEIARSTAFRLDSAYSAAQCLLNTFVADRNQTTSSSVGGISHRQLGSSPYTEQDKASATLSILSEMMSSMEKSKEALEQLSNLHLQSSKPNQVPPSNSESVRNAGRRREDTTPDRWASPTASRRGHSTAPDSSEGEEKIDGDLFDSSPFQALTQDEDKSAHQVLNFEDLAYMPQSEQRTHREGSTLTGSNFKSSKREAKWFPDSGAKSLGATLNAQFSHERLSADFSPWNRQLAASIAPEQLDPVNNLQAQLFDAADTARKVTSYNHSIGAIPAPRAELQSQQFSYNRAGYVWEGIRFNRAQGPVARLCLAQGALIKAHDDYPIRVDAESGVVDVVWREFRHGDATAAEGLLASSTRSNPSPIAKLLAPEAKQNYFTDSSAGSKRNTVLRRERFSFDDVFSGLTAQGRLAFFTRQRARKALETAHNLVFLCLGCGDNTPATGGTVEPPIAVLLGSGGGTGLISSVVDEVFRYTKPLTTNLQESKGLYPGSFPTASPSAFVASKLAFEQVKTRVTLSAIILTEQGDVFDLLGGSADGAASLKRRKTDGRVMLCNASRLQLQASADFDRVMGLLLGKRTALHGVLQSLQLQQAQQLKQGVIPSEPLHTVLSSIDPWASLNNPEPRSGSSSSTSSMLITVSVSGGAVTSNHTSVDFNFISPCGANWSCPGADINILAELISSLPNTPPPSLLRASPLGMLLMDPRNPPSDFINVVTVHRDEDSKGNTAKQAPREIGSSVVQGALHSFRIIAQLTQ